jgi:hypothetical protein
LAIFLDWYSHVNKKWRGLSLVFFLHKPPLL